MVQSTQNQNQQPTEPQLADLVNLIRKQVQLDFNCHHIVTIESFDPLVQTAQATIPYKRTYFEPDALGNYGPKLVDYPVLLDAPVISMRGGGALLTMPVEAGDEGIALFNDRDIDNWFSGSANMPVSTPRMHAFTDAIILLGVSSRLKAILNYSTDAAELRDTAGTNKIGVNSDGVKITNGGMTATFGFDGSMQVAVGNNLLVFDMSKFGVSTISGGLLIKDDGDTSIETGGMEARFRNSGKLAFENPTGELIDAIYQALTTGMAGGFPFVVSPSILAIINSFKGG